MKKFIDTQFLGKYYARCLNRAVYNSQTYAESFLGGDDPGKDEPGVLDPDHELILNIMSPANGFVDFSYILGNDADIEWTEKATLDWGDGSKIVHINGDEFTTDKAKLQHTYEETNTPYQITINGKVKWSGTNNYADIPQTTKECVVSIEIPTVASALNYVTSAGFNGYRSMKTIPADLFETCAETMVDVWGMFQQCRALESIPTTLLETCVNITNIGYFFNHCAALTSIPENLFANCPLIYRMYYTFADCVELKAIPAKLFSNLKELTIIAGCFRHCPKLQSIPDGLFASSEKIENASYCFEACTALEFIPETTFSNVLATCDLNYAFANCESVTSKLPELWISHPYATHSHCFSNCPQAPNYADAFYAGWSSGPIPEEPKGEMVLVCKIPSNNYQLDLSPWLAAAPGDGTTNIIVDWGDTAAVAAIARANAVQDDNNGLEVYTLEEREEVEEDEIAEGNEENQLAVLASTRYPVSGTVSHTYATAGEYRVTVKGEFQWGLGKTTTGTSIQKALTSIELPTGNSPIKHVATHAFFACAALTSIPQGLFDNCTEATNFQLCFSDCSALANIPQGLFDKCTKASLFTNCFYNCKALTSIPQGLFDNCTNVINFDRCFTNCTELVNPLPTLWTSHSSASHIKCFNNCAKAPNYKDAYNAGWSDDPVPEEDEPAPSTISISVNITEDNYRFDISKNIVPAEEGTPVEVNWGDESEPETDKLSHTFNQGEYLISISGDVTWKAPGAKTKIASMINNVDVTTPTITE